MVFTYGYEADTRGMAKAYRKARADAASGYSESVLNLVGGMDPARHSPGLTSGVLSLRTHAGDELGALERALQGSIEAMLDSLGAQVLPRGGEAPSRLSAVLDQTRRAGADVAVLAKFYALRERIQIAGYHRRENPQVIASRILMGAHDSGLALIPSLEIFDARSGIRIAHAVGIIRDDLAAKTVGAGEQVMETLFAPDEADPGRAAGRVRKVLEPAFRNAGLKFAGSARAESEIAGLTARQRLRKLTWSRERWHNLRALIFPMGISYASLGDISETESDLYSERTRMELRDISLPAFYFRACDFAWHNLKFGILGLQVGVQTATGIETVSPASPPGSGNFGPGAATPYRGDLSLLLFEILEAEYALHLTDILDFHGSIGWGLQAVRFKDNENVTGGLGSDAWVTPLRAGFTYALLDRIPLTATVGFLPQSGTYEMLLGFCPWKAGPGAMTPNMHASDVKTFDR